VFSKFSKEGRTLMVLLAGVFFVSCSDQGSDTAPAPIAGSQSVENAAIESDIQRWYAPEAVNHGREVFTQNCAVCHGAQAQGTAGDWREKLDDGSFPPPPLNGSAHAWHHPQEILLRVIDYGGEAMGGKMPAFIDVLDQSEKEAAIAYFQSFWSDEIYQQWMQMGGIN
jgi:mono/diheme cytochrome c family protein